MPSFIKPSSTAASANAKKHFSPPPNQSPSTQATGKPFPGNITLDSIEPVILSGTAAPNNRSPANFPLPKGVETTQGTDAMQPRGAPQLVGLSQLTY